VGGLTRLLIVTYHALAEPASAVCLPPQQLDADLEALARAGFRFVSLDQCADWIEGAIDLPDRSVAVTFDDGYASVVSSGLSVLNRCRVPATLYVVAGRIGSDNRWPGQPRRVPPLPLADLGGLREWVSAGHALGSHSSSHPVLTLLPADALEAEVLHSADRLEEVLQVPVRHFSYPYGASGPRERAVVRRRYRTAVTAMPRLVERGSDLYDVPRLDCHDLRVAARLGLLTSSALPPYLTVRRVARAGRCRLEAMVRR
jgi:peptidoglycan/xylan/chitin deacetylase (PgdA/CDA1 family)